MAAFALPADIETLRGPFSTDPVDEYSSASLLLDVASARLRRDVPGLDANITAGTVDPMLAQWAVCRMVIDVLNNPERYTSEGILDATYRFDLEMVRNQMKPTADELASLQPVGVKKRPPVGTVNVTPWCP